MSSTEVNKTNLAFWDKIHENYLRNEIASDDWLDLDLFDKIIDEANRPVIDLGCGSGNDTLHLVNKHKRVVPCDGSINAILNIRKNFPEVNEAICFDMLDYFPFANNSIDVIIADLSLHYFSREDTIKILKEMRRVLLNNGHVLARVNSIHDENYVDASWKEVEPHLYMTSDGRYKRFFDEKDIYEMFNAFDIEYVRENVMNRYEKEKKAYTIVLKNRK